MAAVPRAATTGEPTYSGSAQPVYSDPIRLTLPAQFGGEIVIPTTVQQYEAAGSQLIVGAETIEAQHLVAAARSEYAEASGVPLRIAIPREVGIARDLAAATGLSQADALAQVQGYRASEGAYPNLGDLTGGFSSGGTRPSAPAGPGFLQAGVFDPKLLLIGAGLVAVAIIVSGMMGKRGGRK